MSRTVETLTIESCPVCGAKHVFTLKIERVTVRSLVRKSAYTLVLNCPKEHKRFQATIENTPESEIESVELMETGNG